MTPRLSLRSSHEHTLETLYQRHAGEVYRYALMMLGSPADAEDITQTTFLNAYRALLRGDRPRASGPWLRKIAHNLCLQHFRQAARRPHEVELEDEAAELVTDGEGFTVEDLSRALRQIPVNQRAALLMRELEGRPIAEIAAVLDVSASAVETLLFRARRAVREQLEGGLTCAEAEVAISRQLDGELKRTERGPLRAHLRECEECSRLARSLRAQRGAMRSLAAIPLPVALAWSEFGPGATGGAVATSAAGLAATGAGSVAGSAAVAAATSGGGGLAAGLAVKLAGAAVVAGLATGAVVTHPWTGSRRAPRAPARVAAATGVRIPTRAGARRPRANPAILVPPTRPGRATGATPGARGQSRSTGAERARGHSHAGISNARATLGQAHVAPAQVSQSAAAHARHQTHASATPAHKPRPAKRTHKAKPTHHSKTKAASKPTTTKVKAPAPPSGKVLHSATTPASLPSTSP